MRRGGFDRGGGASRLRPPRPPYVLAVYGGFFKRFSAVRRQGPFLARCRELYGLLERGRSVPPRHRAVARVIPYGLALFTANPVIESRSLLPAFEDSALRGVEATSATMASADFSS